MSLEIDPRNSEQLSLKLREISDVLEKSVRGQIGPARDWLTEEEFGRNLEVLSHLLTFSPFRSFHLFLNSEFFPNI
jgi:hypothetical protein